MLEREFSKQETTLRDHDADALSAGDPRSDIARFSFDVFDTAICRLVHSPEHVHLLVGRMLRDRGITSCSDAEWLRMRVDAERRCRGRTNASEITIAEIYRHLSQAMWLTPKEAQSAQEAELEAELKLVRPISCVKRRISQILECNGEAFFLSDMYMAPSHIKALVSACGYDAAMEVKASSEELKSKAVGDIYDHIAQSRGLSGSAHHHLGDNFASDYENAKASGWNAEHFTRSNPTSRERAIFAAGSGDFLSSLVAGCVRATRLSSDDTIEEGVLTTASSVVGPLLTGYILWLVLDVHRRGGRTVHFVAGDGELMLALCERMADWLGIAIEARNVALSPEALRMAALPDDGAEIAGQAIAMILDDAPQITLAEAIAGQLHFSSADLGVISGRSGISLTERIADLPPARLALLLETIGTKPFLERLYERRTQAKSAVLDRLASEGFFASPEVAVADIGFRGILQERLQRIVGDSVTVVGYSISLRNAPLAKSANVRSWIDATWNEVLIEKMIGLDEDARDRNAVAVLFADHLTAAIDPRLYLPAEAGAALRKAARAAYRHFLLCPTWAEAEIYGADADPANQSRISRPRITRAVNSLDMLLLPFDRRSPHWRMGSIVRSQQRKGPATVAKVARWAVDFAVRLKQRRRAE